MHGNHHIETNIWEYCLKGVQWQWRKSECKFRQEREGIYGLSYWGKITRLINYHSFVMMDWFFIVNYLHLLLLNQWFVFYRWDTCLFSEWFLSRITCTNTHGCMDERLYWMARTYKQCIIVLPRLHHKYSPIHKLSFGFIVFREWFSNVTKSVWPYAKIFLLPHRLVEYVIWFVYSWDSCHVWDTLFGRYFYFHFITFRRICNRLRFKLYFFYLSLSWCYWLLKTTWNHNPVSFYIQTWF